MVHRPATTSLIGEWLWPAPAPACSIMKERCRIRIRNLPCAAVVDVGSIHTPKFLSSPKWDFYKEGQKVETGGPFRGRRLFGGQASACAADSSVYFCFHFVTHLYCHLVGSRRQNDYKLNTLNVKCSRHFKTPQTRGGGGWWGSELLKIMCGCQQCQRGGPGSDTVRALRRVSSDRSAWRRPGATSKFPRFRRPWRRLPSGGVTCRSFPDRYWSIVWWA